MFNENGQWKEFGTLSPEHTIFPFWLFCITWAIISYIIITLAVGGGKHNIAVVSATGLAAGTLKETEPPEDLLTPLPPKTKSRRNKNFIQTPDGSMKPGYYVLNSKGSQESGVPKYIYVGEEPSEAMVARGGRFAGNSSSEEE